MSVHHLPPTHQAHHRTAGLYDALEHWQDPDWTATDECHVPERRAIDADRTTVERARAALMRRYGVDRFQAFSMMVRWARLTHTPVHTLAMTLVQGIDDADPQPEWPHRPLLRWLEGQLRPADPRDQPDPASRPE